MSRSTTDRRARVSTAHRNRARPAFALAEAAILVVVVGILLAILVIAGTDTRRQARLGEDLAKLRTFGAATASYAADYQGQIWSFSWQGGVTYTTPYPDLNFAPSDYQAQANQAIYLLRTHGQVPDAPLITGWFANLQYSHFVLADYQDRPLPDFSAISAGDKLRLQWAQNPGGTGQGPVGPYACTYNPSHCKTLPRSASFRLVVAAYDGSPVGFRVSHAGAFNLFSLPAGGELGGRPISEVTYPSQKVLLSDSLARHFGACQPWCTSDAARLPLLFADASVSLRAASDANPGWQPNGPTSSAPTTFQYTPDPGDPCGAGPQIVTGRFLWTRGCPNNTLAGRDFGAAEACPPLP